MNVSVSVMERGYGMQTCGTRVCVPYTNGTDDGMIVCLIELVLLVPFHLWCFFGHKKFAFTLSHESFKHKVKVEA